MTQKSAKVLIIAPNRGLSEKVKNAMNEKGLSVCTQHDLHTGYTKAEAFDFVISLAQNSKADRSVLTYQALYICGRVEDHNRVIAEGDGTYHFAGKASFEICISKMIENLIGFDARRKCPYASHDEVQKESQPTATLDKLQGQSNHILEVKKRIRRLGRTPERPVLITGESGTGKELVARALHGCSPRASKPLITINCAAIPSSLFESQFFGHRKGVYTGATQVQKGLVTAAEGGTVFLDEISSLNLHLQPKLLRFLEDGSFLPLGETFERTADVWVLAATNVSLLDMCGAGQFRHDLYYRLNANEIKLAPLRDRETDIPLLVRHFLKQYDMQHRISDSALELLLAYHWPGNVRELCNCIYSAVADAGGKCIDDVHVLRHLDSEVKKTHKAKTMRDIERDHIQATLTKCGFNIRKTALQLEISRNTLKKKIANYGLFRVRN